jgi:hypothetical protein
VYGLLSAGVAVDALGTEMCRAGAILRSEEGGAGRLEHCCCTVCYQGPITMELLSGDQCPAAAQAATVLSCAVSALRVIYLSYSNQVRHDARHVYMWSNDYRAQHAFAQCCYCCPCPSITSTAVPSRMSCSNVTLINQSGRAGASCGQRI